MAKKVMNDGWVKDHVGSCARRFLDGDSDVLRAMQSLSIKEIDSRVFIDKIGHVVKDSKDPDVSQTRKCVEEAIVNMLIEENEEGPRVPDYWVEVASAAIAKHLWHVYEGL